MANPMMKRRTLRGARLLAAGADPEMLKDLKRPARRAMLRKLLEERFHIVSHIEVKTLPVYDMMVLKDGIKFKQFAPTSDVDAGGDIDSNGTRQSVIMTAHGIPMSDLSSFLSERIDRSVIDQTGLAGKYDMQLKWLRDDAPTGGDDAPPTIFTALQEQLGLKLLPSKGPVDTLVIDHIDKPTEN